MTQQHQEKSASRFDWQDARIVVGALALLLAVASWSLRAAILIFALALLAPELLGFVGSLRRAITGKA